jgi:hypothetical protein
MRKLDGKDLDICGIRATTPQLYSGMIIIAVPPFFFISPPVVAILRTIGASGLSILGHASFMDRPIENAFFRGGGLAGRPRTPYDTLGRPPWVKRSKQRKRWESGIPVPLEELDSDDSDTQDDSWAYGEEMLFTGVDWTPILRERRRYLGGSSGSDDDDNESTRQAALQDKKKPRARTRRPQKIGPSSRGKSSSVTTSDPLGETWEQCMLFDDAFVSKDPGKYDNADLTI